MLPLVECRPIRFFARKPKSSQGAHKRLEIALTGKAIGKRGGNDLVGRKTAMLARERCQHIAWADLQEDGLRILSQLLDRRGELNRFTRMPRPISRIGRLIRRNPGAGHP